MSASLVGSEMCIRDRAASAYRNMRIALRACSPRVAKRASEAAKASYVPVSYTHLTLPTICSV
eukprot:8297384-Alexandrium_andersonii.AAC.1